MIQELENWVKEGLYLVAILLLYLSYKIYRVHTRYVVFVIHNDDGVSSIIHIFHISCY